MTYLRLAEAGGGSDPRAIARSVFRDPRWRNRYPAISIAGAWQGLHYLLTGDPWDGPHPAADVVCGGRLLTEDGAEELGVDVIHLTSQRVKLAADHLASIRFSEIAGRYDARRMAELGVQDAKEWVRRPVREVRDGELRAAYENLRKFFEVASGAGEAIYKAMG